MTLDALATLPLPGRLRRIMQALAMLDAVLSPEWGSRRHLFNVHWGDGEVMGSLRDGSGDELFALFNGHGCFIKAFEHELPGARLPPDAAYAGVPAPFRAAAAEPAFSPGEVTFVCWRRMEDMPWRGMGGCRFLPELDGRASTYRDFAMEYFEVDLDVETVAAVFAHVPLTPALVERLNPAARLQTAATEAAEIGYPVSKQG